MLGKLMKYEIKATARWFLPVYGAVMVMAVIARLSSLNRIVALDNNFEHTVGYNAGSFFLSALYAMIWFLFVAFIIAMFVLTLLMIIQRFYKNLIGDEGYLMFTLPVPTWTLITSKLLVAGMWTLSSMLVTAMAILTQFLGRRLLREIIYDISSGWEYMVAELGVSGAVFATQLVAVSFIGLFASILPVYLAIASGGHLWPKHRILGAFGAYLVIVVAEQIITTILLAIYFSFLNWNSFLFNPSPEEMRMFMNTVMTGSIILGGIYMAVYFLLTNYLLSKKLNLE